HDFIVLLKTYYFTIFISFIFENGITYLYKYLFFVRVILIGCLHSTESLSVQ
ncbi:hypothetical protein, partial [uncultured Gammaproteobacteria bacterium]